MDRQSISETFDDVPITQADIDANRLALVKREAGRVVQPKKRVEVHLDAAEVERFKQQADERGVSGPDKRDA
jgi:uncharacterized protein (DUF4415 family)